MDNYIEQAHQTCSNQLHQELVGVQALINNLEIFVAAAENLDALKKSLFYGKAGDPQNQPDDNFDRLSSVLRTLHPDRDKAINILHGVVGLATEAGELCEAVSKALRGDNLDAINVREEVGDCLWYQALILKACGSDFPATMETNIAKLRARFPNRFTEYDANNRDLSKERGILEGVSPDDQKAKDRELADRIEAVWKEIGDRNWETVEAVGSPFVGIRFRDPEGKKIRGFDLTDCPQASARAKLIMKTINTIPRILEILRRG